MKHFLRSVALLMSASSLCFLSIGASAQETDRFYQVNKSTLETFINSHTLEYEIPLLLVAHANGMAMTSTLSKNSTSLLSHPITLNDLYAETESDNKDLHMNLEYLGKSSKTDGYEFNIARLRPYKYIGTVNDKFAIDNANAKTTFTIIFDKEDATRFQIQTKYSKNGTYHSISYTGPDSNQGFRLAADDSKIFSLYCLDYFGMTTPETPIDDSGENITITINPHSTLGQPALFISYILNHGEEVTLDDLLASEHYTEISWQGYSNGPLDIKLPNYDSEATTLWAAPFAPYTSHVPTVPYGPMFNCEYADLSTGITAPAICDKESAPVYYTIQGIRVSQPSAPGIYLCRRGTEVSKILVRR